jgi:hypothetical protein
LPVGAAAPPQEAAQPLDFHILRASVQLVKNTMHDRRVFLAIASISFFWTVGAVLFIEFRCWPNAFCAPAKKSPACSS